MQPCAYGTHSKLTPSPAHLTCRGTRRRRTSSCLIWTVCWTAARCLDIRDSSRMHDTFCTLSSQVLFGSRLRSLRSSCFELHAAPGDCVAKLREYYHPQLPCYEAECVSLRKLPDRSACHLLSGAVRERRGRGCPPEPERRHAAHGQTRRHRPVPDPHQVSLHSEP